MKLIWLTLLVIAAIAYASNVVHSFPNAYGYLKNIAIPVGARIRKAENEYFKFSSRIINGSPATKSLIPYQAGLIIDIMGREEQGVCGGSLISPTRVVTAAHCWFDGKNRAWRLTVVLGSVLLFSGGTRIETSTVITHPNWYPVIVLNDIAMVYLPSAVNLSDSINVIALPTGAELKEDFNQETAIASGFGLTNDGGSIAKNQSLNQVHLLDVITNSACRVYYPFISRKNICTSGINGNTCHGDSGGPLVITRGERKILIGIASFGFIRGCEASKPAGFVRVTSYMNFIENYMKN